MKNKWSHRQLSLLLLISVLPILLGTGLFYGRNYFHFKTINHGTLVNPPIALNLKNDITHFNQWQIVYVPQHCCDKRCDETMFTLHQLRKAFGKDYNRINLVLGASTTCTINSLHDFEMLKIKQASLKKILFDNQIYLVDPQGYLFMAYTADTNPLNILKDLKRVLEVSQIG